MAEWRRWPTDAAAALHARMRFDTAYWTASRTLSFRRLLSELPAKLNTTGAVERRPLVGATTGAALQRVLPLPGRAGANETERVRGEKVIFKSCCLA